jgi:hypothetical protein
VQSLAESESESSSESAEDEDEMMIHSTIAPGLGLEDIQIDTGTWLTPSSLIKKIHFCLI